MPQVEKQKVERQPALETPTARNGSILSRAIPVAKLNHVPLKVLMYGGNRTGKTTLAVQFPKPLLLVSFEPSASGGAESIRKVQGVSYVRTVPDNSPALKTRGTGPIVSVRECLQMLDEVRALGRYQTVIMDSATSCQEVILANLLDLPAVPDQMSFGTVSTDQYRQRSEQTREVARRFIDLPCNTVVLAKERDHNPPKEERVSERTGKVSPDMRPKFLRGLQTESYVAADLGGATVGWIQDACDCICRLWVDAEVKIKKIKIGKEESEQEIPTGKYTRYLRTGYHPNFAAGIRSCDPDNVPEVIESPTYEKLLKAIRG